MNFSSQKHKAIALHIKAHAREDKKRTDGRLPIYLSISVNGMTCKFSTKLSVLPEEWNKDSETIIIPKNASQEKYSALISTKNRLNYFIDKINSNYDEALRREEVITPQKLSANLFSDVKSSHFLMNYLDEFMEDKKSRIGQTDVKLATYKKYRTLRDKLRQYLIESHNEKILLEDVREDFIEGYVEWLKKGVTVNGIYRTLKGSSIHKELKLLRAVFNKAMRKDVIRRVNFKLTDVNNYDKATPTSIEYILPEQLRAIEELHLTDPFTIKVRDLFVFMCYCGIDYADLHALTKDNIHNGNGIILNYTRKKVGERILNPLDRVVTVPLINNAVAILDKYTEYAASNVENKLFPVPSNQKMNERLKLIKELANVQLIRDKKQSIQKNLSSKVSRHTFACLLVNLGNSLEVVGKLLGHTRADTTKIYAKIFPNTLRNTMNRLNDFVSSGRDYEEAFTNDGKCVLLYGNGTWAIGK